MQLQPACRSGDLPPFAFFPRKPEKADGGRTICVLEGALLDSSFGQMKHVAKPLFLELGSEMLPVIVDEFLKKRAQ